jgi:hypothetical protein
MKTLLLISAYPPWNVTGATVLTSNLIKELSKKYVIDLVYFRHKLCNLEKDLPVRNITAFDVDNMNSVKNPFVFPIFTRRFSKKILDYLRQISESYDILFFDIIQTGLYSLYLEHPYKLLRHHDVIYQKYERICGVLNYWIKPTEKKILESFDKVFVLSKKDADIVKSVYHLDVSYTNERIQHFKCSENTLLNDTFVFYGLWTRKENLEGLLWFLKKVMPLLNNFVKIVIIGKGLDAKTLKIISQYQTIDYLGFVKNPLEVIFVSNALIAPLFHGAGIKIKVLDAFTAGTPVLGTNVTFEGLPYIEGLQFKLDTPQEYADAINNFIPVPVSEKLEYIKCFEKLYDNNHIVDLM